MASFGFSRFARLCLAVAISSASMGSLKVVGALILPSILKTHHSPMKSRRPSNYCKLHGLSTCRPLKHASMRLWMGNQLQAISKQEEHKYWKLPRLYVGPRRNNMQNNLALTSGASVPLSPEQAHYLTNVMRIFKKRKNNQRQQQSSSEGDWRDCIRIFDGLNGEWLAKVHVLSEQENESSISGKGRRRGRSNEQLSLVAECTIQLRSQDFTEDERPWLLFVPLKKQPRMKNLIEKCTELGVGSLIPVASDRMEGDASLALLGSNSNEPNLDVVYASHGHAQENDGINERFGKLELQSIEASEQCERLGIPNITSDVGSTRRETSKSILWTVRDLMKHYDWEETQYINESRDVENPGKRVLLICRERGSVEDANEGRARVVPLLQALQNNRHVSFLVGPEGGWSDEEEEMFDKMCSKYSGRDDAPVQCVSLGSSVLRAETASMMAIGAWALTNAS